MPQISVDIPASLQRISITSCSSVMALELQSVAGPKTSGSPLATTMAQLGAAPRVSVVGVDAATHEMGWNFHREGKSGYAMAIMPGFEYRMTGLAVMPGDVATKTSLEYSDNVFGYYMNSPDAITLTVETTSGA